MQTLSFDIQAEIHMQRPKAEDQRPSSSIILLAQSFLQAANLRGVVVCVRGVNPEPVFGRIASVLRVPALARPVLLGHAREHLRGRLARAAKGRERGSDVALVVSQAHGVRVLIVTVYDG